jgi:predicted GH43/DUF377 family glycosyl hydrolase
MFWYITLFIALIALTVLITAFHDSDENSKNKKKKKQELELRRSIQNPIIKPRKEKSWESEASFNPAAIRMDGTTHLLYRAIGADGVSRVGYAESKDGINISGRLPYPVFFMEKPRTEETDSANHYDPIMYPSGGSWGGCEDPRIVCIDDRLYMTFNAFDGWDYIRIGMTSIKKSDFKKRKWNWTKPVIISPRGEINKNWVLFPEKINGKFAILHSLSPKIQVDYVDKLDELVVGSKQIKSLFGHKTPRQTWDTWVRGAGPPPVKTRNGWLVFYHAINKDEPGRYKLGILLLDLKDPSKVIARSPAPVLLPDKWYENDFKPGVVYACGAVLDRDMVYVYYGGGDKHVCVASAPLKEIFYFLQGRGPKPHFSVDK